MPPIYSLNDSIADFFSQFTGINRELCDEKAEIIAGSPVNPCPIQGQFSYAVFAGAEQSKVIQFRSERLDEETLHLAKSIYGEFVPAATRHSSIGSKDTLEVWEMDRILGITFIESRMGSFAQYENKVGVETWRQNIVMDFARFFSRSWSKPLMVETQKSFQCQQEVIQRLNILSESMPSRFTPIIRRLSNEADQLFSNSYPFTLSHNDLCEMNILIDPLTGHLKGIIDWIDAKIQPFGFALWGLQNILGYMSSDGWHYQDNYEADEKLFWKTFEQEAKNFNFSDEDRKRIQIAREIGIVIHYGFQWTAGSDMTPVKEDDDSLNYLDAFLT